MKILRVYIDLPPRGGGMENHIAHLSKLQEQKGEDVTIYFNKGEKVTINDVAFFRRIELHKIKPQFLGFFIFHFSILFHLLFHRKEFDIVHIHGDWSSFIFGNIYKLITGSERLIYSIHGVVRKRSSIRNFILLKTLSYADAVFSMGYETFKIIEKNCNAHFQPSGVQEFFSVKSSKRTNDKFTIVTVANLVPKKNVITILEIAKKMENYDFIIIGDGIERKQLEKFILTNNIRNVKLTGKVLKKMIPNYLKIADVFLFTSEEEGTPTVILEAMTVGLPIVTYNVGGIDILVKNHVNGFVIEELYEVDKYCEKIDYLQDNFELVESIRIENRIIATNFQWGNVAERISKIMING